MKGALLLTLICVLVVCGQLVCMTPLPQFSHSEIYNFGNCLELNSGGVKGLVPNVDLFSHLQFTRLVGANEGLSFDFLGDVRQVKLLLDWLSPLYTIEEDNGQFHCIYAYSPKIKKYILVDSTRINVQIVLRGNRIKMGIPVLLGSY